MALLARVRRRFAVAALCAGLLGVACSEPGTVSIGQSGVRVERFDLVSERVLAPTVTESTYRAQCRSNGAVYDDAIVFVDADGSAVSLVDGSLHCGAIAANGSVASSDTIVVQRDPAAPFDANTLGWVSIAFGPHTRVLDESAPAGARRLRHEVEISDGGPRTRTFAAGISSRDVAITVTDGLVAAATQRSGAVRNEDSFEVLLAAGAAFDPLALEWSLSIGVRNEFALGVTRTLDGSGQPLGDVAVEEQGPAGTLQRSSEPASGLATLAERAGAFRWRFSRDAHLPVWRNGTLASGQVLNVPSPWLARRSDVAAGFSVLNGGEIGDEALRVRFGGGAFANPATAFLTPVGPQSLPGLLPAGWSPLAAFWLEVSIAPQAAGSAELRLADALRPGERAFLVRFDPETQRWLDAGASLAVAGDRATAPIAAAGAYAVVVPDSGATAPPLPASGAALEASGIPFPLPDGLSAQGSVTPPVAAASAEPALVTAHADVVVSHAGLLPSGLVLRSDVDESYALRDGTQRNAPPYETFFVAFQRPGDDDPHTLHARFPLRPQVALGAQELDEARVALAILPVSAFEGGFFAPGGGRVGAGGVFVAAPPGAVASPRAVEMRSVDPARFADRLPSGSARFAFELAADGLAAGTRLGVGFGPQEPDAAFVLARIVSSGARSGLEPRERFASDEFGVLRSSEPRSGPSLPGVTGSGTYVLVRVDAPQALVRGIARDTQGLATGGLAVEIDGEPWLTFSAADGAFTLLATPGTRSVVVTDLRNGDRGTAVVSLPDAATVATTDLATQPAGPRVVEIDPADGARGVRAATPVRITFSERLAPLEPGAVVLRDANGAEVSATLSTNLARTEATLLPIDPLAIGATYDVELAETIADPGGLPIEGDRSFSFTIAGAAARGAGAELISWEPGAQTSECDDVPGFDAADETISCVVGSAGTADPNAAVVIVNETRGTTATVLSGADGSFTNFIEADVDDFLAATFVNANGTRIRIPLSRQLFDDGAVALFQQGGILEAESDGGPVQVLIEPGTIQSKNKFRIEPIDAAALLELIQGSPPQEATPLGAMRITIEGEAPNGPADLSFPVDAASLDLPPDVPPEQGAFAAAIVRDQPDGTRIYEVVDKLRYEDGRITSNTFPFLGLMFLGAAADGGDIFSAIVVPIFLGAKPATVTGRVLECPAGECLGLDAISALQVGKPVRGAFVTLQPPSTENSLRGRIDPGMVYATSGPDGRYALVAPTLARGYVLTATHPKHARPVSEPVLGLFDFSISGAIEKNLVFPALPPGSVRGPVRLDASHQPLYPGPGETATVEINAQQGAGSPTVAVSLDGVEPLVAGVEVTSGDVQLGAQVASQPSATRTRVLVPVTATPGKALIAFLRIRASAVSLDPDGVVAPREILHAVAFGVGPAQVPNAVEPSDANDSVGPIVTNTLPADGAVAVSAGDAISLVFNEPIDASILEEVGAIQIAGPAGGAALALTLSDDQRILRVQPGPLSPDTEYTLSASTAIRDLADPPNQLDQDPDVEGPQGFSMGFRTAPAAIAALPDMTNGGGAVLGRGAHAFAIDRGSNSLVVFDVADPTAPDEVARVVLPGFPRDLVFIPRYDSVVRADETPRTRDLVAVVGGDLGSQSIDDDGNFFTPPQYLRVFDVTNPAAPTRVFGAVLTQRIATITRVEWQPPFLFYFETGADFQQVGKILLQEAMLGFNLTPAELDALPLFGVREIDGNGDGDFVDAASGGTPADRLPVPNPSAEFFGKRQSCLIDDTNQRVLDFAIEDGFCAFVLDAGNLLNFGGGLGAPVPPTYRTIEASGVALDRQQASVPFETGARPKRVAVLFGVRLEDSVGTRDLALVSLSPDADGVPKLAVIDVTQPTAPQLLQKIPFAESLGLGQLQSATLRSDGLIALATTTSIVLLDPRRLALPPPTEASVLHSAVEGVVREAGSGAQSLDGNAAGVNVVSLGGRNQVVLSAPRLRFVAFGGEAAEVPVDPSALVDHPESAAIEFARMREVGSLAPARLRGVGGATATLTPPSRTVHYHVLLDLPGGAGAEVEIALETLNRAGVALSNLGRDFAPVRAASDDTLNRLGQRPREDCDPEIRRFVAVRLSSDRSSPLYNRYLTKPLALTYERIPEAELDALRANPPREILWSGHFLRATIDPHEHTDPVVAPFTSLVDDAEKRLRPGVAAIARSLPATYVMGPNPPPVGGGTPLRGSLGMVDAANGEVRSQTLDLALPSRRMPIAFQRTMAGQDLYEGPFGRGWVFNYGQRIVPLDAGVFPTGQRMPLVLRAAGADSPTAESSDLLFETGTGGVVLFRHAGNAPPPEIAADPLLQQEGWLDATDYYLPQKGVFDVLMRFGDGLFLRVTPAGKQFWYGPDGRLERIYDRYTRNRQLLGYNNRGELIRVDDESVEDARWVRVGYWRFAGDSILDPDVDSETTNPFQAGKIARLLDSAGRDVLFFYNEDGLLERREGVAVDGENGGFDGRAISRYISTEQCSGSVSGVVAGAESGGAALLQSQIDDAATQPTTNGASGAFGSFVYTPPTANRADSSEGSLSRVVGADGAATEYRFDANGRPASLVFSGPGAEDATIGTHYNDLGQLERVVHPEGNEVFHVYDVANPVFRSRNNLREKRRIGGPRGGGTLIETFSYDARYNLMSGSATDADGNAVAYTLRADGRDVESIDYAGAGIRRIGRNEYGQIVETLSPDGIAATIAYDATTGYTATETLGGHETGFTYDGSVGALLGHATTITHPDGAPTTVRHDARENVVEITRGDRSEKRSYDENANPRTIERIGGPAPVIETRLHDQLGFLESVSYAGTDPDFSVTYEPDAARRPRRIVYPGGVREMTYDHQGRVAQVKLGTLVTDYVRDRNGNVVEVREGETLVKNFVYDGHDRVTRMERHPGDGAPDVFDYAWSPLGVAIRTTITDPIDGLLQETLVDATDAAGRVRASSRRGSNGDAGYSYDYAPAAGGFSTTVTGPFEAQTTTSDAAGRVTGRTDSVGSVVHDLDANGNVELSTSIEDDETYIADYEWDALGHLLSISDGVGLGESYEPRADGHALRRTDALGNVTEQSFSALGELLHRRDLATGVGVSFTYDESRMLRSALDASGNGETYDIAQEIPFQSAGTTRADGSGFEITGRDARGNPTTATIPGGSVVTTPDALGRPTARTWSYGAGFDFAAELEFDALDRVRAATFPGGTSRYEYDLLGPVRIATHESGGQSFPVTHTIRADGARTALAHPSGIVVEEGRDAAGRIETLGAEGPLLEVVDRAGRRLVREATLGGVIRELRDHDARRRLRAVRYERITDGSLLADVRYAYDLANDVVARQELHRGGRAELYSYDASHRLTSAHVDARPTAGANEPRALAAPPLGFEPGRYARGYAYDAGGLDLLTEVALDDPDGVPAPPFAAVRTDHDALLHAATIDGFARGAPDPLGNTVRTQLAVRDACAGAGPCEPVLVGATLTYDGASQLQRIARDDGVVVEYEYQHTGLFHRRRVTRNDVLESERAYVWDDGRLLEEWDVSGGDPLLLARWFHRGDPGPFAADLRGANGLERFFYLRDPAGSIVAVADATGVVRERVRYDPFGQPTIEAADATPPRVERIVATDDGVRVEFSEPIATALAASAGPELIASAADVAGAVELRRGATAVLADTSFEDAAPGFPFGRVLRVRFDHVPLTALTLRVAAGGVRDLWGNAIGAADVGFTDASTPDAVLFTAPPGAPTASPDRRRSPLGSPFLFHGEWFDYESGLVFLRARFYDPYTGAFLQRDPLGYGVGPNHYAAFRHNPVSYRDPSGLLPKWIDDLLDFFRKPVLDPLSDSEVIVELEARNLARQLLREGLEIPPAERAALGRRGPAELAEEILQEQGRVFAESVADRVLGSGAPRDFDERLRGLQEIAFEQSGLPTQIVSEDEFKAIAKHFGDDKRAKDGFESRANPARQIMTPDGPILFVHDELVEAARSGGKFASSDSPKGEADAFAVLVGNFQHEVGDVLLGNLARTTAARYDDMIPTRGLGAMGWQANFEGEFVRRLQRFDAGLARDVAPLTREGSGALTRGGSTGFE